MGKGQTWFLMGYVSSLEGILSASIIWKHSHNSMMVFCPPAFQGLDPGDRMRWKNRHQVGGYHYGKTFLFRLLPGRGNRYRSYGNMYIYIYTCVYIYIYNLGNGNFAPFLFSLFYHLTSRGFRPWRSSSPARIILTGLRRSNFHWVHACYLQSFNNLSRHSNKTSQEKAGAKCCKAPLNWPSQLVVKCHKCHIFCC